jgi:EAL domain-containing protein (putative c-di-GMP-specific phosphodiesterase class I)
LPACFGAQLVHNLVHCMSRRAVHVTATGVATSEQAQMCVQSPFAPCVSIF